jgi:hypothetical protein
VFAGEPAQAAKTEIRATVATAETSSEVADNVIVVRGRVNFFMAKTQLLAKKFNSQSEERARLRRLAGEMGKLRDNSRWAGQGNDILE